MVNRVEVSISVDMVNKRVKHRAYMRAMMDLKFFYPVQYESYYRARLAEAWDEVAKGWSVTDQGPSAQHVLGKEGRCVECGDAYPCERARKRARHHAVAERRRSAQDKGDGSKVEPGDVAA